MASLEELLAERARRQSSRRLQALQEERAKRSREANASYPQGIVGAARAITNDLVGGMQGVNPHKAVRQGMEIGPIQNDMVVAGGGTIYMDEIKDDPSYYTMINPQTGAETLYMRTPEVEDSPVMSLGRQLSYGLPTSLPGRAAAPASVSAAEQIGVRPSFAMRGPVSSKVAAAGEGFAPTSARFQQDASRVVDEVKSARNRIAGSVAQPLSSADAGASLRTGAEAAGDFITARVENLYSRVDDLIPPGTMVDVPNTAALIDDASARMRGAEGLMPNASEVNRWQQALEESGGRLTYDQVKTLRSAVGEALNKNTGPFSNMGQGWLKQRYAALTADMENAAKAAGPQALKAWQRANNYRKTSAQRVEQALNYIFKAKSDEQAFGNVLALTGKGSRGNVRALAGIKKSMPGEQWRDVVSTTIQRLGQVTREGEEAFSLSRFLTEYDKMSEGAKQVLFTGKGTPKALMTEMSALQEVIGQAERAGSQINRSRTGNVVTGAGLGAGLWLDPVSTIGGSAAAHLAARAVTSPDGPRLLRAFSRALRGDGTRLQQLARGSGEAAIAARSILGVTPDEPAAGPR